MLTVSEVDRLLVTLSYVRALELLIAYVLLFEFSYRLVVRIVLTLYAVSLALTTASAGLSTMLTNKGIIVLVTAILLFCADIAIIVFALPSGLPLIFVYLSSTGNIMIDIVLILIGVELVRF